MDDTGWDNAYILYARLDHAHTHARKNSHKRTITYVCNCMHMCVCADCIYAYICATMLSFVAWVQPHMYASWIHAVLTVLPAHRGLLLGSVEVESGRSDQIAVQRLADLDPSFEIGARECCQYCRIQSAPSSDEVGEHGLPIVSVGRILTNEIADTPFWVRMSSHTLFYHASLACTQPPTGNNLKYSKMVSQNSRNLVRVCPLSRPQI